MKVVATGYLGGTITLTESIITIHRLGEAFTKASATGVQDIYLDNVKSVNFKSAPILGLGFMQIVTSTNQREIKKATLFSTPNDKYTIRFTKVQQPQFEHLKKELNKFRNAPAPAPATAAAPSASLSDELTKLHDLHQKGAITTQEYDKMKAKLIG